MSETAVSSGSGTPAPAPTRPSLLSRLRRILLAPLRRPMRSLAVLFLLALIGGGTAAAWVYFSASSHLRSARDCYSRRQDLTARDHLEKCLRVWPRDAETLLLAARTARRLGALEDASYFLGRYQAVSGTTEEFVLERLLVQIERGEMDDVREFWKKRIEQEHADAPVLLESLVRGFVRSYRLNDAQVALNQWRQLDPSDSDSAQIEFLAGALEDLRERQPEALDHYRVAIDLDPDRDDIRDRLTDLLLRLDLAREALPHLNLLVEHRPDSASVLIRLVRCHTLLNHKEEARELLDRVIARWPESPVALGEKGAMLLAEGKAEEAETWLRRSLAQAPRQYQVRFQLQQCLEKQHKNDEARVEQARVEELKKDSLRVRHILVYDMQLRPHDPDLHAEAGRLSLRLDQPEDGLRWLESALRLNPRHRGAHEALAEYYRRMGNQGLAARHRELAGIDSGPGSRP